MNFRKLRALVVEDEPDARQGLIDGLNETGEFEVTGWAGSVKDAFILIKSQMAEALFLDIMLIGGTALELITQLRREEVPIPPVIIVTGCGDFKYAQELHNHFKDEVVHILTKPFWDNWQAEHDKILDAIYAQQQVKRLGRAAPVKQKFINIQDGRQTYYVNPEDIVMVKTGPKGQGKTEVVFQQHTITCGLSLAQLLDKLPFDFVQINRFEAVNLNWLSMVDQADMEVRLRAGSHESHPIGSAFFPGLMSLLSNEKQ